MIRQEILQSQLQERQARYQRLTANLSEITRQRDNETRFEEKIRLDGVIENIEQDRARLVAEMESLYAELTALANADSNAGPAESADGKPARANPPPEPTASACLRFLHGGVVEFARLFSQTEIILGRPRLDADLWLSLLPMTEPAHHPVMDAMSRRHAVLRWDEDRIKISNHARTGTTVNNEPLDATWRNVADGALLGFNRDKLQLRARLLPRRWLRLERVNNAPAAENYLLLAGGAVIGSGGEAAIVVDASADHADSALAELKRIDGGFVLRIQDKPVFVNGQPTPSPAMIGLQNGDQVRIGDVRFEFWVGAYTKL